MAAFWDPGAFGPPPPPNADIGQPIRTSLPEFGEDPMQAGLSSWEVIYFAGQRAPGICRVSGGRRRIVDPRWTPGSSGELPVQLFFAPAEFTVTITMWSPAQFAAFAKLVDLLFPKPLPAPSPAQQFATPVFGNQSAVPNSPGLVPAATLQAFDVAHPAFAALKVTSVYVADVRAPEPGPVPQTMVAVLDCVEFRTPPNEGVKVFTSSVRELSPGIYSAPGTQVPARQQQPPLDPSQTDLGPH